MTHTYICYSHEYSATSPTPHVLNTDNTPMYRSTVRADLPSFLTPPPHHTRASSRGGSPELPHGFSHNRREAYIHFTIRGEDGLVWNPRYIQAIMSRNLMVITLVDGSDHVYAALLYAHPILTFGNRAVYPKEDLTLFDVGYDERAHIDHAIKRCHDPSLKAEVHCYCGLTTTMKELEDRLISLKRHWGELVAAKLSCI